MNVLLELYGPSMVIISQGEYKVYSFVVDPYLIEFCASRPAREFYLGEV